MNRNLALIVVFIVFVILFHGSDAYFSDDVWNLRLRFALLKNSHEIMAPSPGPSSSGKFIRDSNKNSPTPAPGPGPGPIHTPAIPPVFSLGDGFTVERCNSSFTTCHDLMNLTACLLLFDEQHAQYLLIQNDGNTPLKVNVIVSSANYKEIQVPEHHAKKVNISDVLGTPLITLDAGNGKCMIHVGSPTKKGTIFEQFSSYSSHINLVSGSYLLFSMALIIGGIWACCKIRIKERQGDGVPYQELELVQHDSPTDDLEAAEGWDQGWDDDWDELRPVDKPSAQIKENGSANGISSNTSDRDEWKNDWD